MTGFETGKRPHPPEAESEAIRWLVELRSEVVTAEDRRRFHHWLTEHPDHETAYRDAQRFWNGFDGLDAEDIREFDRHLDEEVATRLEVTRTRLRHWGSWPRIGALAATVACMIIGGWWLAHALHVWADYRTGTGEHQTITLKDGSRVELNTRSSLSVDLSNDRRRITLHQGEAFFTVAPDVHRPFDVEAGSGVVRALGTAFNVHVEANRVSVTVLEHAVRVSSPPRGATDVPEGGRLSYGPTGELGTVEKVDLGQALAWRRHRLVFENRPIAEVAEELNRYRSGWILLRDPVLSHLTVTGVFDTRHPDKALQAIEESLPVRLVRVTDQLVLLYRNGDTRQK